MPVRAIKTELRCKLCAHAKRREIDELLEQRSMRKINLEGVLAQLVEWGVENPNEDNVKNHWRKHVEIVSVEVAEAQSEARQEIVTRGKEVDVTNTDAVIDRLIELGVSDLEAALEAAGTSGVTVDQLLKALSLKTQRKSSEAMAGLFGSLGKGIEGVFKKALDSPAPVPQLPAVEAEYEEVNE